jgi:hypothetical protein
MPPLHASELMQRPQVRETKTQLHCRQTATARDRRIEFGSGTLPLMRRPVFGRADDQQENQDRHNAWRTCCAADVIAFRFRPLTPQVGRAVCVRPGSAEQIHLATASALRALTGEDWTVRSLLVGVLLACQDPWPSGELALGNRFRVV